MVDSRNVPSENKNTARIEKNKTWWIFSHSPELIVPWGWNGFLAVATCCFQGNPNAGSATLKENKKEKDTLNGIYVFISIIIIFLIYFLFIDLFFILSYIYTKDVQRNVFKTVTLSTVPRLNIFFLVGCIWSESPWVYFRTWILVSPLKLLTDM